MTEAESETYTGPERRARDRSLGLQLRRRRQEPVENERRKDLKGFDIASALEMHLDECKTRRAMLTLLERWLVEARSAVPEAQDADYITAIERSIEVMKSAPDLETAIFILQRRNVDE
jgi:hypothetical protein